MRLGYLSLGIASLVLCAAAEPPAPPPQLEPYIEDGMFDPGDFGWMKGGFDDADERDKADFEAITAWADACVDRARAETRTRLAELGYPDAALDTIVPGPLICRQVVNRPDPGDFGSFASLEESAGVAEPFAEAFLFAVRLAELQRGGISGSLSSALLARPTSEQMLGIASSWGDGQFWDAPELPPMAREILVARLGAAIAARYDANTEWLKGIVERQGWPKVSVVGEQASNAAWLMVQHADHDPVFQLEVLRLMEPLVAGKEVSPGNYAYLYDRVMLKLGGKQRYATQMICADGVFVPQPLEDEASVERMRAEAGLVTLADYAEQMKSMFGACD